MTLKEFLNQNQINLPSPLITKENAANTTINPEEFHIRGCWKNEDSSYDFLLHDPVTNFNFAYFTSKPTKIFFISNRSMS